MAPAAVVRQEEIAQRWLELVAAGQQQSAEALALYEEFAALDRAADEQQTATPGTPENATCHVPQRDAETAGELPGKRHRATERPATQSAKPAGLFPLASRPGRRRVLSEFRQGQLAALLAIGIPLRESARWLQISRSTAQRAKADRRLQAAAAALALQMQSDPGFRNGPNLPA